MQRLPFLFALILVACTSLPTARYHQVLDPLIGQGKKADVEAQYGPPTFCGPAGDGETCEYVVPSANGKPTRDVIHLYFDSRGLLAGWEPLFLPGA